jgi:hypothetical protein
VGGPLVTGAGAELTEEGDAEPADSCSVEADPVRSLDGAVDWGPADGEAGAAEDVCDDAGFDSADVDAEGEAAEEAEEGDGVGFDAEGEAGEDDTDEPGDAEDFDGDDDGDEEGLDGDEDGEEGREADGEDDADGLGLPDGDGQCFMPGGHDGDAGRGGVVQGCATLGGWACWSCRQSWSPRCRWIQSLRCVS